jgi:hypothetical protein
MAKTELNSALTSISGGIDQWVYRHVGGRTLISRRATITHAPTAAQQVVREQFRHASAYANAMTADPVQRAAYETIAHARRLPVRQVMMTDFLRSPVVDAIDLADYHGAVGDPIAVRASDDTGVVAVDVEIRAADQTLLERGAAMLQAGVWVYHATTARIAGEAVTIAAIAVDRPGHGGTKTESWM